MILLSPPSFNSFNLSGIRLLDPQLLPAQMRPRRVSIALPTRPDANPNPKASLELLLPGALLMAMGAQLLAPLMFVDLGFASFL